MNKSSKHLAHLGESWSFWCLGSCSLGVGGGGLGFLWFKIDGFVAIVRLNKQKMALINSAPVPGPLIEKFGLLPEFDGIQDNARQSLVKMRSRAASWFLSNGH